jgi:type VI secretion system protein ImpG
VARPLDLLYEDELRYIRRLAAEFARQRPAIAARLLVSDETGESKDPLVERLIESFAFLTARIRAKIEDEFPEITEALLQTLYPHYLAPVPAMAMVQFDVDPVRCQLAQGFCLPRGSQLQSPPVAGTGGLRCRFRTAYPVTLWPLEVVRARYETPPFSTEPYPASELAESKAMLRIELRVADGMQLAELELDRLRFYISGDAPLAHKLYELIFRHVLRVAWQAPSSVGPRVWLTKGTIHPVGFGRDEGLLPYSHRSFLGYRLLTEYFAFPRKFLFFDLTGLEALRRQPFADRVELQLYLDRAEPPPEPRVTAETFRLGCTPVVNLFSQTASPVDVKQLRTEYDVQPYDAYPQGMEIYSIDSVESINRQTGETIPYHPLYSLRHGSDPEQQTYWLAHRRPSLLRDDPGTNVSLSLVDLAFNPRKPPTDVLYVKTTCSNRELPARLHMGGGATWDFELEGQAPLRRIVPLVPPTASIRVPFAEARWRLISHLALNHLSITDEDDGAEALREILRLYAPAENRVASQHVEGIVRVASRRTVAPISDGTALGFCRGVEVEIELDEEKYVGTGMYLFACVLDRFLGLYASINSVTRLVARIKQGNRLLERFPFRAGEQTLL